MANARPVPTRGLLRVLGVAFGIAVSLGNSIGGGIMRTPATIASQLPSAPLVMVAWLVGAAYSLLGAWSLAEVAAMTPSAGGYYAVSRRAFGSYAGFVVGWADWISLCGGVAATALLTGEYVRDLGAARTGVSLPALGVVGLAAIVQWRGVRSGSRFQKVTSAMTAVVFVSLIIGAFALARPVPTRPVALMPTGMPLLAAWVLVLQAVLYTYDGWYSAIYFGDEFKHPDVELPRSMIDGVLLLSALFLGTNAALFWALGPATLAEQNLPLAAIGSLIFGDRGQVIVRALLILTLVGLTNAAMQCASRILYGMGRDGWGPPGILYVNRGGTPTVALMVSALVALTVMLTGSFDRVLAITTFFYLSKYLLSYLAVFSLRRREATAPRPYRAFGYPWTTGAAVIGSVAFLIGAVAADTRNTLYGGVLMIVSYPLYRLLQSKGISRSITTAR